MRVFSQLKKQWLALGLLAALPGVAHADLSDTKGCFTPVGGINGLAPNINLIDNGGLLDSRWVGGFGYGWETGGLGEGEFKAVSDGNFIYVSTRHYILESAIQNYEGMQVGFAYTPNGATSMLSQIIRVTFGAGPGDTFTTPSSVDPATGDLIGTAPLSATLFYKKGTGATTVWQPGSAGAGVNPLQWVLDSTRMFILTDANLVTTTNPSGLYYIIQMAIPIKAAPEATDPAAGGLWTTKGVYVDTTKPITYWADLITAIDAQAGAVIYRSWPDPGLSDATTPNYALQNRDGAGTNLGTPDPTKGYSTMQIGSPAAGTCSGTGLGFANTDIHDTSAVAAGHSDGNLLLYSQSGTTITPSPNNLQITVTNSSTTPYTPSDISAKFFIAPYGSQTGAVSAGASAWAPLYTNGNQIQCSGSGATKKCSTTVGNPIAATTSVTTPVSNNGTFSLNTTDAWAPDKSYLCAVVDQTGKPYDSYPGFPAFCAGQPWLPAQQNAAASTTTWDGLPFHTCMQVELSVTGSASGGVIFANKSAFRNMYTVPASAYRESAIVDTRGLPAISGTTGHDIYLYTETRNMPASIPGGDSGPVTVKTTPKDRNPAPPTYNDLGKTMPTFAVHTYWDTGKTTVINGKKIKVLEPMTSYGNFVTHDYAGEGAIYGWDAHLEGVTQIGPHTYKVTVPNNGRVSVVTSIQAYPSPVCPGVANPDVTSLLQSLAPVLATNTSLVSGVNQLLAELQIKCVDLNNLLKTIGGLNWGTWNSWVQLLITEILSASGCKC